ncbi:hypothetical protein BDN72DRAFT_780200 [Pluteus cervinus]|uniref:Uncharacterized protein n=1 Tax=Pluteus cervinus TaxID=181527 RepID=A0ACD3A2C3_9AGAR|nr:hypothetical protein BDN72DRAFT_780200 [Pluteus cervinus]
MSRVSKPLNLARLNDLVLGAFSNVAPSDTLNHLARFLGTWNGSDKMFMVVQNSLKIVAWLLQFRARMRHRAGLLKVPVSDSATRLAKAGSTIGDSRMLWRFWGLLPIFTWLISLERHPQATRNLLTIERLQGWSMLGYYPLEHLFYLSSHGIIPSSIPSIRSLFTPSAKPIELKPGVLGMWSCRFWALYVALQFAHLREDRKLMLLRQRSMRRASGGTGLSSAEQEELKQRWDAYWSQVLVNLADFPLTIHWSLEKGLFKNEIWLAVFGLASSLISFRTAWRATALPSTPPSENKEEAASEQEKLAGFDVSS